MRRSCGVKRRGALGDTRGMPYMERPVPFPDRIRAAQVQRRIEGAALKSVHVRREFQRPSPSSRPGSSTGAVVSSAKSLVGQHPRRCGAVSPNSTGKPCSRHRPPSRSVADGPAAHRGLRDAGPRAPSARPDSSPRSNRNLHPKGQVQGGWHHRRRVDPIRPLDRPLFRPALD